MLSYAPRVISWAENPRWLASPWNPNPDREPPPIFKEIPDISLFSTRYSESLNPQPNRNPPPDTQQTTISRPVLSTILDPI